MSSAAGVSPWAVRPPPSSRALRFVLVVALDREAVADCLGVPGGRAYWPSTLYAWAAETALRSPAVWERCGAAIEDALSPWLPAFADCSAHDLAACFGSEPVGGCLSAPELAAALWSLLRRRDAALRSLTRRLAMEAEVRVAQASTGAIGR